MRVRPAGTAEWGEADAADEAAQEAQGKDDRPEFDEQRGHVVHRRLSSGDQFRDGVHVFAGADDNEDVATGEAEVRGGEGNAVVRRSTATMEAPVLVRA